MSAASGKFSASFAAQRDSLTRRYVIRGAAAFATGIAAQTLLVREASAANYMTPANLLTPVKNQHKCNACTAFAVVAAIETTYYRKYPPAAGKDILNLSESQLFFAAGPKAACEATHWWPEDALGYCLKVGLAREDQENFVDDQNKLLKINKASRLIRPKLKDTQDEMRAWISSTGPVIAVMAEYSDFFGYNGGATAYYPGSGGGTPWLVGGHVLAIVGYDDMNKCWTCKNSYGKTWNGNGYVNIAYGGSASDDALIDQIDVWGVSF
jgi:C1A family cysteine protease